MKLKNELENIETETITHVIVSSLQYTNIKEYAQRIITEQFFKLKKQNKIKKKRLNYFIEENMPKIKNNKLKELKFKIINKDINIVFLENVN